MKRILTNVFLLQLMFTAVLSFGSDEIDALIDKEQAPPVTMDDVGDELPPTFLLGNESMVEIYAADAYQGEPSVLCQPLEFDELIELSGGDVLNAETPLNMKLPRVRDLIEKSCLIRPGDSLVAIQAGTQTYVTVKTFVIRRSAPVCPQDSPFALWGLLSTPFDSAPLLFATSLDLEEGANNFRSLEFVKITDAPAGLKEMVPDLNQYAIHMASVGAANCDALVHLTRSTLSGDDDDFPNEIVLWQKGTTWAVLAQEKVDLARGSGRVGVTGVLDFNNDGPVDVMLHGDQFKCSYRLLFEGNELGFSPLSLPTHPCSC